MGFPRKLLIQVIVIICILYCDPLEAQTLDHSQDVLSQNFHLREVVRSTNPVLSRSTTTILEDCIQYCIAQPGCVDVSMSADNDCEMFDILSTFGGGGSSYIGGRLGSRSTSRCV